MFWIVVTLKDNTFYNVTTPMCHFFEYLGKKKSVLADPRTWVLPSESKRLTLISSDRSIFLNFSIIQFSYFFAQFILSLMFFIPRNGIFLHICLIKNSLKNTINANLYLHWCLLKRLEGHYFILSTFFFKHHKHSEMNFIYLY